MHQRKDRSGFAGPGFLASAALVAFIGCGAAALLISSSRGGADVVEESPNRAVSAMNTEDQTEVPGNCDPLDVGKSVPRNPPRGIAWRLFGAVALPYSATAGPLVVEKATGVARCFAHTPVVALLAVDHLSVRYVLGSDWRRIAQLQVVPGEGRAVFLKWRAKQRLNAFDSGWAQSVGFRFVTYTDQVAVIEKVLRSADGSLGSYTFTVEWHRGDWKLQLQPDGIANPTGHPVETLDGYVPWSGV